MISYAVVVAGDDDWFRAFAATPMPHVDESIAEMGRALDELGVVGMVMSTTVLGQALVDPQFEPVFAELDRRSAVLYLRPAGNSACPPLIRDDSLTWMVGAPVEDTISTMELITSGISSRDPGTKIIKSHVGGALHMLLPRADNQYTRESISGLDQQITLHQATLDRAANRFEHRGATQRPRASSPASAGGTLSGYGNVSARRPSRSELTEGLGVDQLIRLLVCDTNVGISTHPGCTWSIRRTVSLRWQRSRPRRCSNSPGPSRAPILGAGVTNEEQNTQAADDRASSRPARQFPSRLRAPP
jgi:hypothetical protein